MLKQEERPLTFYGADLESLRMLGAQLDDSASRLDAVRDAARNLLTSTPWQGPDAEQSRHDWATRQEAALTATAGTLRDAATGLRAQAADQESTSTTGAITGESGGGVGVGSGGGVGVGVGVPVDPPARSGAAPTAMPTAAPTNLLGDIPLSGKSPGWKSLDPREWTGFTPPDGSKDLAPPDIHIDPPEYRNDVMPPGWEPPTT